MPVSNIITSKLIIKTSFNFRYNIILLIMDIYIYQRFPAFLKLLPINSFKYYQISTSPPRPKIYKF